MKKANIMIVREKQEAEMSKRQLMKIFGYALCFDHSLFKIHIVPGYSMDSLEGMNVPANIVLHQEIKWKEVGGFLRIIFHTRYLFELFRCGMKVIKRHSETAIISNAWGHETTGIIVILLSKLLRRKSIIRVAGDVSVPVITFKERHGKILGFFIEKIMYRLEDYVLRNANLIIAVSPLFLGKYSKYKNKTAIVPDINPAVDKYCKMEAEKPMRESENMKILYVGRLEPEKGVNVLLHSLVGLEDVECSIVGDGSLRDKLKRESEVLGLQSKVKFHGDVPQETVFKFMELSDILVLPSYSEYSPNVLVEAGSIGVPILASNVAGIKYLVKDYETGVLFNVGDPKDLREKIIFLINNLRIRKRLVKRAKRYVCRYFNTAKIKRKLNEAVMQLL